MAELRQAWLRPVHNSASPYRRCVYARDFTGFVHPSLPTRHLYPSVQTSTLLSLLAEWHHGSRDRSTRSRRASRLLSVRHQIHPLGVLQGALRQGTDPSQPATTWITLAIVNMLL